MRKSTGRREQRGNQRKLDRAEQQRPADTPALITWSGHYTPAGEALAAWLTETDACPFDPAQKVGLLPAASAWFRQHPDEAAQLWRDYQAQAQETAL